MKGTMLHLFATEPIPNLSAYHLRVPDAVTPRLTATKTRPHRSVLLHQAPRGAVATAIER